MSVKSDVLHILENNKGTYYSGEDMAGILKVSRTAVWKAVKALIDEGYDITGVNNRGYCMKPGNDVISAGGILRYMPEDIKDKFTFEVYKTITSTNTVLKQRASEGAGEWLVLVAEEQTQGKGRMNRTFYSPSNTGIYMSYLLKPDFEMSEALFVTTMTAVAVSEAIDEVCNIKTGIKWVNDIYYDGRKICGILTEAAVNVENSKLDYAVVGIGINVRQPENDFPQDIKDVAGSIVYGHQNAKDSDNLRNRIIAKIAANMYKYYLSLDKHEFMSKYKEKSILIGKEVYILTDKNREPLEVIDVDDHAALVVRRKDGTELRVSSGEVSVRLL